MSSRQATWAVKKAPGANALPWRARGNYRGRVIRVSGPVTLATMRALKKELLSCHPTDGSFHLLLDFRSAVLLLDDDDWLVFNREWLNVRTADVGLALLVHPESVDGPRRFAWECVHRGFITLGMSDAKNAYRWLDIDD